MNRLNLITLGTKDIVKANRFYRNLGFKTVVYGTEENPSIVFFQNEGSKISLFPLNDLAKDISLDTEIPLVTGFNGITLAYNAKSKEEVDVMMQKAVSAGATIQKQPTLTDWGGYSGYFTDLDGYYWEVAYGADWEFDESNMLIING